MSLTPMLAFTFVIVGKTVVIERIGWLFSILFLLLHVQIPSIFLLRYSIGRSPMVSRKTRSK